jgi:hypothetical protein
LCEKNATHLSIEAVDKFFVFKLKSTYVTRPVSKKSANKKQSFFVLFSVLAAISLHKSLNNASASSVKSAAIRERPVL